MFDSIYLTVHHLTAEPVPCSLISGCETVLTSTYAEIAGVPLAAFGAAAYFAAFSLALLAAFGNRNAWFLFGIAATGMAGFTLWLLYLQAFRYRSFLPILPDLGRYFTRSFRHCDSFKVLASHSLDQAA